MAKFEYRGSCNLHHNKSEDYQASLYHDRSQLANIVIVPMAKFEYRGSFNSIMWTLLGQSVSWQVPISQHCNCHHGRVWMNTGAAQTAQNWNIREIREFLKKNPSLKKSIFFFIDIRDFFFIVETSIYTYWKCDSPIFSSKSYMRWIHAPI